MGGTRVSPAARQQYLQQMRDRYVVAKRAARSALLDEAVAMTGYHRKALIRRFTRPLGPRRRRRGRPRRYGPTVVAALRALWRAAGYPWSVRLKALLPVWLPRARRPSAPDAGRGERSCARSVRGRWTGSCRRTSAQVRRRLYGRTKPGTLLKHHVPLRTDRWDVTTPGWTEVDLVAHSGDRADGEFAHTVNQTDIVTTWVESRAVLGKSQVRVQQALEAMRHGLPFRLLGHRLGQRVRVSQRALGAVLRGPGRCNSRAGRPYKKDDNAHIEQKNWTHVRKLVGYERYDTEAAVDRAQHGVCRAPPLPESLLADGEAGAEGARRRADAPALRRAPDAAGPGARVSGGRPGEGGRAGRAPRAARPLCPRDPHRSPARAGLHPRASPGGARDVGRGRWTVPDLWTPQARPQGRWTPARSAGAHTVNRHHRQRRSSVTGLMAR